VVFADAPRCVGYDRYDVAHWRSGGVGPGMLRDGSGRADGRWGAA